MSALLRLSAWLLAVALVLLPVVAVLEGWIGADRWPLQTLRVHGTFERIDEAKLRETLLPYAQAGFFAVELREAQDELAALPWVERAEVRKRWPDVLEVTVVEHRPFARWGKDQLLSDHGRLFPAAGIEVGLEARHAGRMFVNDANSDAAEAYTVAAVRARYQWNHGRSVWRAFIRVDNAFDKRYAGSVIVNEGNQRFFEPAPGRSWLAGLRVTL